MIIMQKLFLRYSFVLFLALIVSLFSACQTSVHDQTKNETAEVKDLAEQAQSKLQEVVMFAAEIFRRDTFEPFVEKYNSKELSEVVVSSVVGKQNQQGEISISVRMESPTENLISEYTGILPDRLIKRTITYEVYNLNRLHPDAVIQRIEVKECSFENNQLVECKEGSKQPIDMGELYRHSIEQDALMYFNEYLKIMNGIESSLILAERVTRQYQSAN